MLLHLPGALPLAISFQPFGPVVGRPFRVALLRVQTAARLKPCPTHKKKVAEGFNLIVPLCAEFTELVIDEIFLALTVS